ncbi:MAG: pyruvoyl-dependent arginine decarboxylase, partial [Candidatus Altiarchaeota archaeon]|nr:pyruvoyl-dependent arginine decarboxylase [Candidatus Altiarchaeota archaeon]
ALINAGIGQCNLIKVSSILPRNCVETPPVELEPGTLTFTVLSRSDGVKGEEIASGIGCAVMNKEGYGLVAEDCINRLKEEAGSEVERKLREMASSRGMGVKEIRIETESLRVDSEFGCIIAALVYLF